MNNDIKEILEYLKESATNQNLYFEINPEKANILLDYITNLQEELEEQKRIEQASLDTITNLEEENERLLKEQGLSLEEINKIISVEGE